MNKSVWHWKRAIKNREKKEETIWFPFFNSNMIISCVGGFQTLSLYECSNKISKLESIKLAVDAPIFFCLRFYAFCSYFSISCRGSSSPLFIDRLPFISFLLCCCAVFPCHSLRHFVFISASNVLIHIVTVRNGGWECLYWIYMELCNILLLM